jgi:putative modified peptide
MPNALPPAIVEALLDKLGSDDGFRELFQEDPRAALARLGYEPDLGDGEVGAWACLRVTRLASKEAIADDRGLLYSQLTSELGNIPHKLDVA